MNSIVFFNNKGGVGKTSLVYHVAWMFAELGVDVVAVDLDPQSNLTSSFLDEEQLVELWDPNTPSDKTILDLVRPLLERMGDIQEPDVVEVHPRIGLVPGNLGLSLFEDRLAETWGKCLDDNRPNAADAFRVTTAFYRLMDRAARRRGAEVVLIDVGPNLGAINRAALVAADHVVIPLAADLFSLQGLRNLGPTLHDWRSGWWNRRQRTSHIPPGLILPSGAMKPAGYVVMQPSVRERYPVKAFGRWAERIPGVFHEEILRDPPSTPIPQPDPEMLALIKNYRSLAPMAQEARKPMFALKPADGALGGHVAAVKDCYEAFRGLTLRIASSCDLPNLIKRVPAESVLPW